MLNYYYNDGMVLATEATLDYNPLSEEQIFFYKNNANASLGEILKCRVNVPFEATLYNLKEIVYKAYADCEAFNTGASGTLKIAQFAEYGCSYALANVKWINDLYSEMYLKISQLECGVRDMDLYPSEELKYKPYPFYECEKQYNQRNIELCIS